MQKCMVFLFFLCFYNKATLPLEMIHERTVKNASSTKSVINSHKKSNLCNFNEKKSGNL